MIVFITKMSGNHKKPNRLGLGFFPFNVTTKNRKLLKKVLLSNHAVTETEELVDWVQFDAQSINDYESAAQATAALIIRNPQNLKGI